MLCWLGKCLHSVCIHLLCRVIITNTCIILSSCEQMMDTVMRDGNQAIVSDTRQGTHISCVWYSTVQIDRYFFFVMPSTVKGHISAKQNVLLAQVTVSDSLFLTLHCCICNLRSLWKCMFDSISKNLTIVCSLYSQTESQ